MLCVRAPARASTPLAPPSSFCLSNELPGICLLEPEQHGGGNVGAAGEAAREQILRGCQNSSTAVRKLHIAHACGGGDGAVSVSSGSGSGGDVGGGDGAGSSGGGGACGGVGGVGRWRCREEPDELIIARLAIVGFWTCAAGKAAAATNQRRAR